jgi:protein-tyrosine phosphatase
LSINEGSSPEARAIHVPGVLNVRDLGGLTGEQGTLRKGLILRTAGLEDLTEEGAQALADLGLRTVIDLRTQEEREEAPDRISQWPQLSGVREVWLPFVTDWEGSPDTPIGSYLFMAERGAKAIGAAFEQLAVADGLPAIIHCAAGKDRTGLTVAVLQSWLGVPSDAIEADFIVSNEILAAHDALKYPAHASALAAALAEIGGADGDFAGFLAAQGVSAAALDALRTALIDPASTTHG